jgi:hypothetical protein
VVASVEDISSTDFKEISSTDFEEIPSTDFEEIPSTNFEDIDLLGVSVCDNGPQESDEPALPSFIPSDNHLEATQRKKVV